MEKLDSFGWWNDDDVFLLVKFAGGVVQFGRPLLPENGCLWGCYGAGLKQRECSFFFFSLLLPLNKWSDASLAS